MLITKLRANLFFISILSVFLAIFSVMPPVSQVLAAAGDVQVTVTREVDNAPLSGATVEIQCAGGTFATLGTTDGSGMITAPLPMTTESCDDTDTVDLQISVSGYVTKTMTNVGTYDALVADPNIYNVSAVEFGQKVTLTREGDNASLSAATITAGSLATPCIENASVYYCATPFIEDGTPNDISIALPGYITTTASTIDRTTDGDAQASITVSNVLFALKVTTADELGNIFPFATFNTATFNTATPDFISGNTAYWATAPMTASLVLDKNGYVDATTTNAGLSAITTSDTAQVALTLDTSAPCAAGISASTSCKGLEFGQKITVTREGDSASISGATITAGSLATACIENASTYYCAVPVAEDGGVGDIQITKIGYVTNTSGATIDRVDGTGAQASVAVSGILFQLKAIVSDELGTAFTFSGLDTATFNGSSADINSTNTAYWAVAPATAALILNEDGYVDAGTTNAGLMNVTTSAGGQIVITLGANPVCGSAISTSTSCKGLEFGQKITVTREGDNASISGATITAGSLATACIENASTYYCAVPVAEDGGANDIVVAKTGYVTKNDTTANRTSGTSIQSSTAISNLLFQFKTIVSNELGTVFNISNLDTATFGGVAPSYSSTNSAYWAPASGTNALSLYKDGYANTGITNAGFSTINTSATGQLVITLGANPVCSTSVSASTSCKGLEFAQKLTVTREGDGAAFSGAVVTAGSSATACIESGAGIYYCAVLVAQDGGAGDITVVKDTYVTNTSFGTTNRTAISPRASISVSNVLFGLKVVDIRTIYNTNISGDTVTAGNNFTITCPEFGTTGVYYCSIPVSHVDTVLHAVNNLPYHYEKFVNYTDRTSNSSPQQVITLELNVAGVHSYTSVETPTTPTTPTNTELLVVSDETATEPSTIEKVLDQTLVNPLKSVLTSIMKPLTKTQGTISSAQSANKITKANISLNTAEKVEVATVAGDTAPKRVSFWSRVKNTARSLGRFLTASLFNSTDSK
ncbi:MAG: hypothetical protein WC795_00960 [Candidatus Paceibacterota bacterium]|jgi:phosphopantetheine adenylyltransferase